MDCSPPGSSDHGILQARTLEWVTFPFSSGSSRPRDRTHASCTGRQFLYHWDSREAFGIPGANSLGKILETCYQQQESNQVLPNHMFFLLSPFTSHSNVELRKKTRFWIFLKQTSPLPPSPPTSQLPASLGVGLPSFPLALCQPPKPLHFLSDPGVRREAKPWIFPRSPLQASVPREPPQLSFLPNTRINNVLA